MKQTIIQAIKVRPVSQLLQDFVAYYASKTEHNLLPLVQLTCGAQSFTGTPVRMEKQGQEHILLLLTDLRNQPTSISFISTSRIDSLSLLNPGDFHDLLTRGDSQILDPDSAPSRLELEREVVKVADQFSKVDTSLGWKPELKFDWQGLESDPSLRAAAKKVLTELQGLIPELLQDALGKSALREISHIHLVAKSGEALQVQREATHLKVHFGIQLKPKNLAQELKTQFESQL